jgi:SagB-type dehydrogenase family enzyme
LVQVAWAAQGITDVEGFRTAPSAGALYPLELYVASRSGLYHYDPGRDELLQQSESDLRQALYRAALSQEPVMEAPAIFAITAVFARTSQKYGRHRGERDVHIEVGHAAQNLLLQAAALDLAAVPVGAFDDEQVRVVLRLQADEAPLYLIPVGHPR